jgi:molecular chaperone GrpE
LTRRDRLLIQAAMTEDGSHPKGFTVVDRRASAMAEEAIADAAAQEAVETKPTYVAQIELALAEKDRKLREIAAELTAVQERTRRESAREVERSRRALLVDLLDVADNLDRALGASGVEDAANAMHIAAGVGLVRDLLAEKLSAHGVVRIEALGARFDPKRHEAQALVPVEDAARDGVVIDVYRQGYAIGGDVIRPAGVAVGRASRGSRPV